MCYLVIRIPETKPQHGNNIFINYPPRGRGRLPRAGDEGNAFPQIVAGDFGNSGIEGDDTAILDVSVYPEPDGDEPDSEGFLAEWEDIFAVGELLRTMIMTHLQVPEESLDRPGNRRARDVNQAPTAPPYSDELIELLERFEFPDQHRLSVRSLRDAVDTTFPSPEDLRDNLLPQAQRRVAAFRNPAVKPAGYFDSMDMSWTKRAQLMPFNYIMELAAEAGDGPDGGPPPEEEDDGSEGGHGGGGSGDGSDDAPGDGHGDGGDVQMPDSPSAPDQQDDRPPQQPEDQEHPGGAGDVNNNNEDSQDDHDDGDDDDDDDNDDSSGSRPPPPTSEQLAMRLLGRMHKWNDAKPRYELRSLEFAVPTILPLKAAP